jgi:hypothetical protein
LQIGGSEPLYWPSDANFFAEHGRWCELLLATVQPPGDSLQLLTEFIGQQLAFIGQRQNQTRTKQVPGRQCARLLPPSTLPPLWCN